MEQKTELNIVIPIGVSAAFHAVLLILVLYNGTSGGDELFRQIAEKRDSMSGRDIIVNMNEDNKREDKYSFLSDRDSTAKGHLTKSKGDTWLNNSRDFRIKGGSGLMQSRSVKQDNFLTGNDISVGISKQVHNFTDNNRSNTHSTSGNSEWTTVPDAKGISRQNAMFFSNDGQFSYSTAKFRNFDYFNKMKNKIAQNWYPPAFANAVIGSSRTGGRTKLGLIPSQEVKLYFTMNRNGDVLDVIIVDSMGNYALDESCSESITMSKNFGRVPSDISGEVIVIPFIFGYYVR